MVSITPVQNNSKKSQQTFGMNFTRSTPKLLKRMAPQLVVDKDLPHAKTAIKKIAALTQKNYGLTVKIAQEDRVYFPELLNVSVKTKDSKGFVFTTKTSKRTFIESLSNLAEYLSGSKFIPDIIHGKSAIENYNALPKMKKLGDKINTVKDGLQNAQEIILELPETILEILPAKIARFSNTHFGTWLGCEYENRAERNKHMAQVKDLRNFIDEQFSYKKA